MDEETIDGVRVEFDKVGDHLKTKARAAVRRQAADIRITRAKVCKMWRDDPFIDYELADIPVTIVIGEGHEAGQLLDILDRHARQIESYRAALARSPVIDMLDAHVALSNGGVDALRSISKPDAARLRITRTQKLYPETVVRTKRECKFPGGRLDRIADRIEAHVWTSDQVWNSRSLLVASRHTFPQAVVNALPGRRLDETVQNTLASETGAVIDKAWSSGGRLGLSFATRLVPVEEAFEKHRRTFPLAA